MFECAESVIAKNSRKNGSLFENTICVSPCKDDSAEDSEELFSDNNEDKELIYSTPKSKSSNCSTLDLTETSLLHTNCQISSTPEAATIPKTPLGLLPFLTKINEQWTSDLETPQSDKAANGIADWSSNSESVEKSVSLKTPKQTPTIASLKNIRAEPMSSSPVINCKRIRKRPKRRIFKSSNSTDVSCSVHSEQNIVQKCVEKLQEDSEGKNGSDRTSYNDQKKGNNKYCNMQGNQTYEIHKEMLQPFKLIANNKSEDEGVCKNRDMLAMIELNSVASATSAFRKSSKLQIEQFSNETLKQDVKCNIVNLNATEQTDKLNTEIDRNINDETIPMDLKEFSMWDDVSMRCTETRSETSRNIKQDDSPIQKRNSNNSKISTISHLADLSFSTASGKKICISDAAISKAKSMFTVENDDSFTDSMSAVKDTSLKGQPFSFDRFNNVKKSPKAFATNLTFVESRNVLPSFSTASGKNLQISEKALSKAKLLFANELNDMEDSAQQVSGTSNVMIAEAFNTILPQTLNNSANNSHSNRKSWMKDQKNQINNTTKCFESDSSHKENYYPSSLLSTAGGSSISVSEKALLSTRILFADNFTDVILDTVNKSTDLTKRKTLSPLKSLAKSSNCKENSFPPVFFSTAGGSAVTVSEKALSSARKLFADDFSDVFQDSAMRNITTNKGKSLSPLKNTNNSFKENLFDECNINFLDSGFQTAGGQSVTVSKNSLLKATAAFSEETTTGDVPSQSFQKRKSQDLDCDMASEQSGMPIFKRTCVENESHINHTERKEINKIEMGEAYRVNDAMNNGFFESKDNAVSTKVTSTAETVAATEKNCYDNVQLSPVRSNNGENNVSKTPSSPIIGRQSFPRKRRSAGIRRKARSSLVTNNAIFTNINCTTKVDNNIVNMESSVDIIRRKDLSQRGEKRVFGGSCDTLDFTSQNRKNDSQGIRVNGFQSTERKIFTEDSEKSDCAGSSEFGDTQLMIDFIDQSERILEKRSTAVVEQEKALYQKKRCKPKPKIGSLLAYKTSNFANRISWSQISEGVAPVPFNKQELVERGVSPEVIKITATTAVKYKFNCVNFYGEEAVQKNTSGFEMEDGVCLIPNENGHAGITEIKRAFLAIPAVDPSLIPAGWVENHYNWIVWKLASMDRMKFGSAKLPRVLTPARVLSQLKYRYDREIDRAQRPVLRRILEKDDAASKRMVLCVSSITQANESENSVRSPKSSATVPWKMVLTDGWYSIPATIDQAMVNNIISGKVREGTKLFTYGAELLNCDQGNFPLEIPANVSLKIHTNSTRRAKWDTKLGYGHRSGPILTKLRHVAANGGLVGRIAIVVSRVYPVLYCEKLGSGETICRNARCEEKANMAYEKECLDKVEAFYENAERRFDVAKNSMNKDSLDSLADELNESFAELANEETFSKQQQENLMNQYQSKKEEYRKKLESKLRESLPPARQVSQLLKIRIIEENTSAILSIWSPDEDVVNSFKEGDCILISNVYATGRRAGELQLKAGRQTLLNRETKQNKFYPARKFTPLSDLYHSSFNIFYSEFDTVGVISSITENPYGMKNFEAANLAYPRKDSDDSSYLSILFWQGMASCGYAEILTVGSVVACSNLEWRRSNSWNIPISYCTEKSVFTQNPRASSHLHQPFQNLRNSIALQDLPAYVAKSSAEISLEMQRKSSTKTQIYGTPEKIPSNTTNPNRRFSDISQELRTCNPDCDSPNLTTVRSSVQKRLQRLHAYGEPPQLPPITLNNSPRVSLTFQSPIAALKVKQNHLTEADLKKRHSYGAG